MSCTELDVRDYFFGELPEAERAAAERHVQGCGECAGSLEQLREMRVGLLSLREEEPPQRIGFVSDKVFQPSPFRRWLAEFWVSGARLGFASAAMLSLALLVFAARQPRTVETRVPVAVAAPVQAQPDVKAAVSAALAEQAAEQDKKTRALLAALEEKHHLEERAQAVRVSEFITNFDKRMGNREIASLDFNGSRKPQ